MYLLKIEKESKKEQNSNNFSLQQKKQQIRNLKIWKTLIRFMLTFILSEVASLQLEFKRIILHKELKSSLKISKLL